MIRLALAALSLAAPTMAADVPARLAAQADARLARLTAGRTAGTPLRCISPERFVQPERIPGRALAYRRAGTLYVTRLGDSCPQLREGRTIVTSSINGEICRNDSVRIYDAGLPVGQCVFGDFTPYTR